MYFFDCLVIEVM